MIGAAVSASLSLLVRIGRREVCRRDLDVPALEE
jgi:hypothetical protein